jgi:hypothetical protein
MKRTASKAEAQEDKTPQRRRFIVAAREIGCDESGEAFEHVFSKIVPPKAAPETRPTKARKSGRKDS